MGCSVRQPDARLPMSKRFYPPRVTRMAIPASQRLHLPRQSALSGIKESGAKDLTPSSGAAGEEVVSSLRLHAFTTHDRLRDRRCPSAEASWHGCPSREFAPL